MSNDMKAWEVLSHLDALDNLAEDITKWATEKGFWKSTIADFDGPSGVVVGISPEFILLKKSQKLMLVVSELSECLEGLRKPTKGVAGFTNEEEEIADAIIRLLDYAGQYGLRIGQALGAKMAKNEGRPYMHGKNF